MIRSDRPALDLEPSGRLQNFGDEALGYVFEGGLVQPGQRVEVDHLTGAKASDVKKARVGGGLGQKPQILAAHNVQEKLSDCCRSDLHIRLLSTRDGPLW